MIQQSIKAEAYTGYQGEQGENYSYAIKNNCVIYSTNHDLKPFQGLTIVVTFPKGFVVQPSWYFKMYWLFRDNISLLLICIGLLWLLMLLVSGMTIARRMNMPGIVIPRFYPPAGMMPCDVGFMNKMQFDNVLLSADIVDLAVRNFITITYSQKKIAGGVYTLTIKDPITSLSHHNNVSAYDKELLLALFGKKESLTISKKYSTEMQAALAQCEKHTNKHCRLYITMLTSYLYRSGLLIFLIVCGFLIFLYNATVDNNFFTIILIAACCSIVMCSFLRKLFCVYTPAGRKKQDEIDGFKLYLMTAEMKRMNLIGTPPTRTPELYEKYLPYAIALGIEKQWTKQFSTLFKEFAEIKGHPYTPLWYHGRGFTSHNFGSKFVKTFTTTIAASSTRPGKSSGSGGGGRSGGGGGGGGGGGW